MSPRLISPVVVVYASGLVAAQVYHLNQGITELAALDTHYLLTGAALIVCFLPGVLFVAVLELSLGAWTEVAARRMIDRHDQRSRREYLRTLAPLALLLSSSVAAILWFAVDRPDKQFFDFRLYAAPRYYVYWNVAILNLWLVIAWLVSLALVRLRVFSRKALGRHLMIPGLLFVASLLYWSRTIYPAIDPALGGAAPKMAFVEIERDKPQQPILLLFTGEHGIYCLQLSQIEDLSKIPRDEAYWWNLPLEHPLVKRRLENRVVFLPRSTVQKLVIVGDDGTLADTKIRRSEGDVSARP